MKSKVYYDIDESIYSVDYNEFKLYFSSETNMNKFNRQIDNYIEDQTFYLLNRYGHVINLFDDFLTVALYKRIEKRGFKVFYEGKRIEHDCVFISILHNHKMIKE